MKLTHLILFFVFALAAPRAAGEPPVGPPAGDGAVAAGEAEPVNEFRRQMREDFGGIGVEEQLGQTVDLDAPFLDHRGEQVTLRDFIQGDIPVVVTFVYHDCPMLCSRVLEGFTQALQASSLTLGSDYRAVAISIDPRDTPVEAAGAHERYGARLADAGDPEALAFLTGDPDAIERVTSTTGFSYRWVEERQEYAHTAALVFVSPEGTITRYLYGLQFPALDFRRALLEAGEGTIGSPVDQLLLYCFIYDPDTGGYVLHATNAMKLGGFATIFLLGIALLAFWRRETRANRQRRQPGGVWAAPEDVLRTARQT